MNVELRPGMKRWINNLLGWEASGEIEELLDEEDVEEIDSLADEVAMDEWTIGDYNPEDFEQAIKAHRAKMMEFGGEKLRRKCRLQKKYVRKAGNAEFAPVARTLKEKAADKRSEIRMDVKKLLAHGQRARKLRKWVGALTSAQIEAGTADEIDLEEISPEVKEMLTDPANDELSPEMEEAEVAVEMQMEEDGADRAFDEIEEQVQEVEEKGEDADIDIGLDDDIEELEESDEVSTMFQNDL
jgi:hypothetical protein